MATTHETEHGGGGHPSLKQYVFIAVLLFVITIVEFVLILDSVGLREASPIGTTVILFLLSGIKFAIVILFYMHLKFDNKFFFWVFIAGMVLAVMVGLSLIGLFTAIKGGDLRADDAPYVQCAFDHGLGAHGENVCPTPAPQPTSTPHPVVPTIVYTAPVVAAPAALVADVSGPPDAGLGEQLYMQYGCNACHTTDGTSLTGPTWLGLYGSQEQLADGTSVTVDDEYIKESIQDPNAKITAGFTAGLMPTTLGVKDEEIPHIIEYMKSLQ